MHGDSRLVRLLDAQQLSGWHVVVAFCCFPTLFLDGMDVSAPSVTTSAILKRWSSEPATASVAGLLGLAALRDSDAALKVAAIVIAVGCGSVTLQMYATTEGLFYPTPIRGRGVG